eukprot:TRINITY_DN5059_c0_g1_i6.p1 TRINITY_DN5059_c0_g1~~TRINITY_DN5059_c0_g1_i6.p1  ORF type:complete len:270 (-),score=74.72 TRINITY_DN5059_c0_g1_i6:216-1025(-)
MTYSESYADQGIRTVDNLKTITQEAEVVVSMLPNDKIVTEVFEGQIFQNIKKGSLLIDCSTISPMAAEKLHNSAKKYNQNFVDAPVSGGVMAAKNAKLTFMVGTADAGIFAKCKEVLSLMGPNVFQCQKPGGGQVAKACNNMALAIEMLAVSEALSLGNKLGLDPKILSEVMKVSSSRCWSLEVYNPVPGIMPDVPASKNYEPGFASELMLKDLGIAKEAAQSVGAKTEFGFKAQQFYEQLVKEKGMGRKDFAIAYDVIHKSKQKRKKT